jgi:hypothetical protein
VPPTVTPATLTPTSVASPSPTSAAASPTPAASETAEPTATPEITLTPQAPLLTGRVTMCDTGANLISFRIRQPPPDLTGQTITAQIADAASTCYVNQTNPSLLTCRIPAGVEFPARVVISIDGAVAQDFTYDGLGCEQLSTPLPTTTP